MRTDMDFATFARKVRETVTDRSPKLHVSVNYLVECYGARLTVEQAATKIHKDGTCQASNT